MENASKALLMAGGVLVAIMIISLAMYLFANFGGTSSQIHDNIESNQISQFNSQFTSYVGQVGVTIHDVMAMASLASQNNISNQLPKRNDPSQVTGNDNYITVILAKGATSETLEYGYVNGTQAQQDANIKTMQENYNEKIEDEVNLIGVSYDSLPTYNVTAEISETTRRVYRVICTQN